MPQPPPPVLWPKTGRPAQNALDHAGYRRLEDLARVTEAELLALHGMGPKAVRILKAALAEKGLTFKSASAQPAKAPPASAPGDFPKLAAPARRALAGAGYTRLAHLAKVTEADLLALHGLGPNALAALRAALQARGLSFKAAPKP